MNILDWLKPEPVPVEHVEVSDEYARDIDDETYLKALEDLRVHRPDAYETVLERWRKRLQQARRVTLFTAAHPRDFIANAAIAQQARCHTFEDIVDDMEQTTNKTPRPRRAAIEEDVPAAIRAGS